MSAGKAAPRAEEFAQGLKDGGFPPGRPCLVHSAYRPFKQAGFSAADIFEGLRLAAGRDATILFPALSYEFTGEANPVFDEALTKSCVGYLAELFRAEWSEARSMHPSHSVSALGKDARFFCEGHEGDSTPVGPRSPFMKLARAKGLILMLGCGFKPNTSMHGYEELVGPPYLYGPERKYRLVDRSGKSWTKVYRTHGFQGVEQRYDRLEGLLGPESLRGFAIAGADCALIESADAMEAAVSAMRADPWAFVDKAPEAGGA